MSGCVQTFDWHWGVWKGGFVVLHDFVHHYGPDLEPQAFCLSPALTSTLEIMNECYDKEQLHP